MNFIEITPEEFTEFANKSPYKSFTQTTEIASLRERNSWVPYYLGVSENGKIVAATMLVAKPTFLGKSTYLAPGGPLLDYENTGLVDYFFKHLRAYAKSHNGYLLQISPNYELIELDRDGNPVPSGFNHQTAKRNLKNLGFTEIPHASQPKYHFAMDIEGRTPDELFADMKRNTRNHIRKAEKSGVTIRELKRDELHLLKQITESTSKRRGFEDRPLSYYEQMYDLFHDKGEVKFMVAEVTPDDQSSEKQSPLVLSAAMFMLYGDEIIYLFSGSDENYMKEYNAQYLIQWHMIKYASEHNFKRYNFYGISGRPKDGELDGIYEFKKGFDTKHGKVLELIGTYDLSVNSIFFAIHKAISKLRSK